VYDGDSPVQDNLLLAMDPEAAAGHGRNAAEQAVVEQDADQPLRVPVSPGLTLQSSPPNELHMRNQLFFDEN
jgi:hypothetical protein